MHSDDSPTPSSATKEVERHDRVSKLKAFGRMAYRMSIVMGLLSILSATIPILLYLAGAASPSFPMRFFMTMLLGTTSIGSVLLGVGSMVAQFRFRALLVVSVGSILALHFILMTALQAKG